MNTHLRSMILISICFVLSTMGLDAQENTPQSSWNLTETIQVNHINMIGPTDIGFSIDYPSGWLARKRSAKLVINALTSDHQQAFDYPVKTEGYSVLFAIERKSDFPEYALTTDSTNADVLAVFSEAYGYQQPDEVTETDLLSWPALQVRTQDRAGNHIVAIHGLYGEHGQVILMSLILAAPTAESLEAFLPTWESMVNSIQITAGFVDLGGYSVMLNCEGQGVPTVLLESGTNDDPNIWASQIPIIRRFSQVCTHLRTRIGDEGVYSVRDYVDDLHLLLEKANTDGSYIMVGPWLGGYFTQVYAGTYPEDLAGIVLVDSFHAEHFERRNALFEDAFGFPKQDIEEFSTQEIADLAQFGIDLERSIEQVASVNDLGHLPLFVVSPDQFAPQVTNLDRLWQRVWLQMQQELPSLSTNSQLFIVEGAFHSNILQRIEVAAAILTLVQQTRDAIS